MSIRIHSAALIAAILFTAFLNSSAYAGAGSGGGGDPGQLEGNAEKITSPLNATFDQMEEDQAASRDLRNAKSIVQSMGTAAIAAYDFFVELNYPFQFDSRINKQMLETTFDRLDKSNGISVESPLYQYDSQGVRKRVTFISDPASFKMKVDLSRASAAMNDAGLRDALISTLFHEALVLNRIEPSMTYTNSEQLAVALKDIVKPEFQNWAVNSLEKSIAGLNKNQAWPKAFDAAIIAGDLTFAIAKTELDPEEPSSTYSALSLLMTTFQNICDSLDNHSNP